MRRFPSVFALLALMTTSVMPVAATEPSGWTATPLSPTGIVHGSKTQSGRLAESDKGLIGRTDAQLVNVMIKLDVDAAATYRGGLNGLQATSPSVTGKSLRENAAAVAAYQRYVHGVAADASKRISAAVPAAQLGRVFATAFGGISAKVPANQARALLGVRGVSAVMYDKVEQPLTDATPDFIGATALYPQIGGNEKAGQGVKVGVLDTGIWPEHPSFSDPGITHPGGTYACEFGLSGDPNDPAFACNDKLIGAYAFLDTNFANTGPSEPGEYCPSPATCSARDADGHGTHTSSTAAGRRLASAVLFGVERGPISGIAPGAHLIHYRVCDLDGCYSSDSVNAVEQAITDDVDVINFSISGGNTPYSDAVELAFLDAYAAGILVNASAGNDGPGASTANHGGAWVNTVGASTSDRHFLTTLHLANGATLDLSGVTVTAGINSPTPVVLSKDAPYSNELCDAPAAPGTFTGKVVACQRGAIARVEKGYNVMQGGAVGMILYNVSVTDLETDNHFLPTIHVNDQAETIEAFVTAHPGATAMWSTGVASTVQGDVMASFSSRGPLDDFIKPDVTAPGIQILAGASPQHIDDPAEGLGPDGEFFQAIAGTSMSSPHAAGAAALLKDRHPGWTPGEIKSALMTTAVDAVLKEDFATPADPFDMGAGSIRVNLASKPTVGFDVPSSAYYASAGDPDSRIHLNIASVNAPNLPGLITTWRTARNLTPVSQTLDITATGPSGAKITLNPSTIQINAWQTKTFFITIDATKLADGQYFGEIVLNPRASGYANAELPVAFNKQPGEVHLTNSCAAAQVAKGAEIDCEVTATNHANTEANVSLRVKGPRSRNLLLNDWDAGNKKGNGFVWNGNLSPTIPPQILSLTPGHGPGGGFLPLAGFGITPESGYGDETVGQYTTPSYSFGGEVYNELGIDSNGYLVVGPASAEDNNCCDTAMPDPARPNNVLAPYWTDLNPGAGGNIYIGILTDGVTDWIIVEWNDVPVFGQPTNTVDAQIWLTVGGTADEGIWFEHGTVPSQVNTMTDLIVGAENRDGSDAATIGPEGTAPANTGYEVITSDPTPGGSMTIHYDAKGVRKGTYKILSTLTADVMQGTATDLDKIKVTP